MNKPTMEQAAKRWRGTFNEVPASVLEKLAATDKTMPQYASDSLRLIAGPYLSCADCRHLYDGDLTLDELRQRAGEGHGVPCPACPDNWGRRWTWALPEGGFPCGWGTLYAPPQSDVQWILDHAETIGELSLFVFESEDYGCLLGIDCPGVDFDEAFWIPLYRLRTLKGYNFH